MSDEILVIAVVNRSLDGSIFDERLEKCFHAEVPIPEGMTRKEVLQIVEPMVDVVLEKVRVRGFWKGVAEEQKRLRPKNV